jgi:hypothetical protein
LEKYAPDGGYITGTKVDGVTLDVGKIIDRYGNPRGSYTSPVGVPYEQRALPYIENPNAYHQYEFPNSIEYLIDKGYLKEIK